MARLSGQQDLKYWGANMKVAGTEAKLGKMLG